MEVMHQDQRGWEMTAYMFDCWASARVKVAGSRPKANGTVSNSRIEPGTAQIWGVLVSSLFFALDCKLTYASIIK